VTNNMKLKYKQVIVLRTDIEMSCGKAIAQAAHASLMAAEECRKTRLCWLKEWWKEGQKKVVLKVENEGELKEVYEKAKEMNLPCAMVVDMGLTELPPGTRTAVAIGPAPEELINKITGNLRLYK